MSKLPKGLDRARYILPHSNETFQPLHAASSLLNKAWLEPTAGRILWQLTGGCFPLITNPPSPAQRYPAARVFLKRVEEAVCHAGGAAHSALVTVLWPTLMGRYLPVSTTEAGRYWSCRCVTARKPLLRRMPGCTLTLQWPQMQDNHTAADYYFDSYAHFGEACTRSCPVCVLDPGLHA